MKLIIKSLPILLALSLAVGSGGQKPKPDPCGKATVDAFNSGFSAGLVETATLLTKGSEPIPIEILLEDIPEKDSYQLAAADTLRAHFSDKLKISMNPSSFFLHIAGTKKEKPTSPRGIDVSANIWVKHSFVIGGQTRDVLGAFVLAHNGTVLHNYTDEHAAQVVREMVYAVLSEALGKLESQ